MAWKAVVGFCACVANSSTIERYCAKCKQVLKGLTSMDGHRCFEKAFSEPENDLKEVASKTVDRNQNNNNNNDDDDDDDDATVANDDVEVLLDNDDEDEDEDEEDEEDDDNDVDNNDYDVNDKVNNNTRKYNK